MDADDQYDDSTDRDQGVFIGRHNHEDRLDEDERHDVDLDEPGDDEEATYRGHGLDRDPELWSKQLPLIEEDADDGLKVSDFPEESIPRIIDAMGDEAAEPLLESPNGTSATGSDSPLTPDHGGFPERE